MRHYPLWSRLTHALNGVAVIVLVMSGLGVFNAHPALYVGEDSDPEAAVLTLPRPVRFTDGSVRNRMSVFGRAFDTGPVAMPQVPAALTLGGWLAGSRRLHFFAAWAFVLNGALYLALMLVTRRGARVVWPTRADWRGVGPSLRAHLRWPPRLRGADGGLNPLQKAAYLAMPVVLGGGVVATGLALSPQWDAMVPAWVSLFGGRQAARSWHFVCMAGFVLFTLQHVALVALSGTWARMVTGREP